MSTPPFDPQPCGTGGAGEAGADVEQVLLCDILPDGQIAGTALAVYEYDGNGNPVGAPVFVNPATGAPYVAQGVLQPCPGDTGCGQPTQFCFQSTAPVDQPGRMYDTTLTMAQGFAVQGLVKDLVDTPLNIIWEVTDPDGTQFAADLQTAVQSQFPGQTVTVTPGAVDPCAGGTADFAVHIECLRLDQNPPTLLQFRYNSGRDLVINPAFLTNPPMTPADPLTFVKREDVVGGAGTRDVLCTSVADRGWETNDNNLSFELWGPPGSPQNSLEGTTPTPRGTSVQEINSFGSGPVPTTGANAGNPAYGSNPDTIWQTFTVPAAGNFNVRVVVGGRAATENIPVKLSTGDVGDTGIGDIVNTSVNAGKVTNENATPAGPWTTFNQVVPLAAGTYTLAFTGPENPITTDDNAFGGLFTDMRVFQDAPNTIQNFTNDDETCVVPTSETSTVCEFWAPRCSGGNITGWYNVADGEDLTNADFWAQVPAPTCCPTGSGDGGSGSTGNLVHTYLVCGTLNGEQRTMSRVVVTDQSGGIIADTFIDTDGGPVTPDTWQPGDCSGSSFEDAPICYTTAADPVPRGGFRRERREGNGATFVEFVGDNGVLVTPDFWRPGDCTADTEVVVMCDDGTGPPTPFLRRITFNDTGFPTGFDDVDFTGLPYVVTGDAVLCDTDQAGRDTEQATLCDNNGPFIRVYQYGTDTGTPSGAPSDFTLAGAPYVPVGTVLSCSADPMAVTGLCLADGTPIAAVVRRDYVGIVSQDGWINLTTGAFTAGSPPAGTVACGDSRSVQVSGTFCDMTGPTVNALVLIEYSYNPDGTIASVRLVNATTGVTHVPVGTITTCPVDAAQPEQDLEVLCDVNGGVATPFIRDYRRDQLGAIVAVSNYTLAGGAYAPTGTVGLCSPVVRDEELLVLCDATPTRFLRRYNYDAATGALIGIVNTTLDGSTPFAPVGAVAVCTTAIASDFDFLSTVLCDSNGTQFIQRLTFNSSTGAVTATTNTSLTGGAFVPVGAVSLCSDCCPVVIGEGCTNTGSGFYTAIRATNGTITLIDSVSGAAIVAGNIVACPSDNTARTLTAQARVLTNGTPWTPGGDVAGTLTSLTVTGTLGLWDMVDQNGTALANLPAGLSMSWAAEDDNTLTGPTSVTPQAGATVVASWTQR